MDAKRDAAPGGESVEDRGKQPDPFVSEYYEPQGPSPVIAIALAVVMAMACIGVAALVIRAMRWLEPPAVVRVLPR